MEREKIFDILLEKLEKKAERLKKIIEDTKRQRDDAPSRNESRYDSLKAELQYLLNSFNRKMIDLAILISDVKNLKDKRNDRVDIGSIVFLSNGLNLIILPTAEENIEIYGKVFTIISPNAPIFNSIKYKKEGEKVLLPNGVSVLIEKIL